MGGTRDEARVWIVGTLFTCVVVFVLVVAFCRRTECHTMAPADCNHETIHADDDPGECECNRTDGVELEWQGRRHWTWE